MANYFESKTFKTVVYVLGVIVVVLAIFYAGIQVGFRRAEFSYRWGQNYERNFGGPRGMMGMPPDDGFINGHGSFGQIVRINLPQVVIKSPREAEKVVVVGDDTQIRSLRDQIKASDLKVGDSVVVIGAPDDNGQIKAGIIRILPPMPDASSTRP